MSRADIDMCLEHARLALIDTIANLGPDHEVTHWRRTAIAELEMRLDGSTLYDIGYTMRGGPLCDYASNWTARAA